MDMDIWLHGYLDIDMDISKDMGPKRADEQKDPLIRVLRPKARGVPEAIGSRILLFILSAGPLLSCSQQEEEPRQVRSPRWSSNKIIVIRAPKKGPRISNSHIGESASSFQA